MTAAALVGTARETDAVLARIKPVQVLDRALEGADDVQERAPIGSTSRSTCLGGWTRSPAPRRSLASATSGFPASRFPADLAHRRRCVMVHPLNPPVDRTLRRQTPFDRLAQHIPWRDRVLLSLRTFTAALSPSQEVARPEIAGTGRVQASNAAPVDALAQRQMEGRR